MIDSVRMIDDGKFSVTSEADGTNVEQKYEVFMGDDENFCYCHCKDYRRHRMLCKHFFAIFASKKANFDDLTCLFRNHPLLVLDESIYANKENNDHNLQPEMGAAESEDNTEPDVMCVEREKCDGLFKQRRSQVNSMRIGIRSYLKQLIDLTYNTSDIAVLGMCSFY